MPAQENRHATVVVLKDRGVLIMGGSGSGKSSLALALIRHCYGTGVYARLIGDDQIFLSARGGRLIAHAPETIAGLAEVYGIGPRHVGFEGEAVVDLVVSLVEQESAPRLNDETTEKVLHVDLPRIILPARNTTVSTHAILAAVGALPFG